MRGGVLAGLSCQMRFFDALEQLFRRGDARVLSVWTEKRRIGLIVRCMVPNRDIRLRNGPAAIPKFSCQHPRPAVRKGYFTRLG